MNMQYEHYITRNIRSFYRRSLFLPVAILITLFAVSFFFPIRSMLRPIAAGDGTSLKNVAESGDVFLNITLKDLYFTGYRKMRFDTPVGYYYYTMRNDECVYVLLSPQTCEQGNPYIEEASVYAEVRTEKAATDELTEALAGDLSWNKESLSKSVSPYLISEADARSIPSYLLILFFVGGALFSLLSLVANLLYIAFPRLSPPIRKLGAYGDAGKILKKAEDELMTLPQLATEDMFITEHFFIETSPYGTAIVPINKIIWIYKYSTLHKFLWHHFSISYTLYITAKKRIYIKCPKNIKSDIDGIMDYLAEANHSILVGFSEENRIRVEELQGEGVVLRKIMSFLSKRV